MNKVSESIFSGKTCVIPMADVSHIEKQIAKKDNPNKNDPHQYKTHDVVGYFIITKNTTWNQEIDFWNNNIWLSPDEGNEFLKAWCFYRYELEGGEQAFVTPCTES